MNNQKNTFKISKIMTILINRKAFKVNINQEMIIISSNQTKAILLSKKQLIVTSLYLIEKKLNLFREQAIENYKVKGRCLLLNLI